MKAVVNQLIPLVESKNINLELCLFSDELFAKTHDDCFCLMVYNLIGHCLKDVPVNGRVTVDAYTEGLDFVFVVMHNGDTFTPKIDYQLKGKHVLVTDATGFIGGRLL